MSRSTAGPTQTARVRASPGAGQVLVAVISHGPSAESPALAGLADWKRMNPLADWTSIDLRHAPRSLERDWVERTLAGGLSRRHMRLGQLVLLGERDAGRLALELVLDGTLECAGILVVDVPLTPLRADVVPTLTAVRLVMHASEAHAADQNNLLEILRGADIDERIMMLPSKGGECANATARAAETFLTELVARTSRQVSERGRSPHV